MQVSLDPGWTLTDPDVSESHVWSSVSGGGGKFVVDTSSGFVYSMGRYTDTSSAFVHSMGKYTDTSSGFVHSMGRYAQ